MLLRRITQHVKDQNWFAVFLDFIIVVFGVFIGIQVANWNEVRQERAQESIYLARIITELETSIEAQKEEVAFADRVFEACNLLIKVTDQGSLDGIDRSEFELSLRRFGVIRATRLNNTTFEELQSSGRVNFIRNDQVRKSMSDLNHLYERQQITAAELRARFVGALDLYDQYVLFVYTADEKVRSHEYDLETMSNSKEFKVALRRGQRLAWLTKRNHRRMLEHMEQSLSAIKASN